MDNHLIYLLAILLIAGLADQGIARLPLKAEVSQTFRFVIWIAAAVLTARHFHII